MSKTIDECARLIELGKWDKALEKLSRLIQESPMDRAAHEGLLKIFSLQGNLNRLEEELMRYLVVLARCGQDSHIIEKIYELLALARDKEDILKRLVSIFKMSGKHEQLYHVMLLLVKFYIEQGKKKHAVTLLDKLKAARFDDPGVRIEIGLLYGKLGNQDTSLIVLKEALWDSLRQNMTVLTEKATHALHEVTGDQDAVLFALAEAYEKLDDIDSAAEQYIKILKIDKENYHALLSIGKNLFATERYELAVKTFSRILKALPEDIDALKGLAGAYEKMGLTSDAINCFKKVARACLKQKKYREAHKIFQYILQLDKDNKEAKRGLEKIHVGSLFARKGAIDHSQSLEEESPVLPGKVKKTWKKLRIKRDIHRETSNTSAIKDYVPSKPITLSMETQRFLESSAISLGSQIKNISLNLITLQGALLWRYGFDGVFKYTPFLLINLGKILKKQTLLKGNVMRLCMLEFDRAFFYFAFLKPDAYVLAVAAKPADYGIFFSWMTYIHNRLDKMIIFE